MNIEVVPATRPSVYLASKSPRRQELLRQIGVDFTPRYEIIEEALFVAHLHAPQGAAQPEVDFAE